MGKSPGDLQSMASSDTQGMYFSCRWHQNSNLVTSKRTLSKEALFSKKKAALPEYTCKCASKWRNHLPVDTGSCDQSIWNSKELRKHYENKEYGILGDSGFSFNWKNVTVEIISAKPKARPKKIKGKPKANLSILEKSQNTTISKYWVVVENTISQIKEWQILAGWFRHYTASKQKQPISLEDVLWVCCGLTNQKIKRKLLHAPNW